MKNKILKESVNVFFTLLAAVISAFTLHVFVYKNGFAPSGVDGIATMVQETLGWNAGLVGLIINIPLLFVAYFVLNKKYVLYTILFTVFSSVLIFVLALVEFPQYEAQYERFVASIFSGLLLGMRTGIMIRMGFSTGGVDIVSAILHKKKNYINIEKFISGICYVIIGVSYFVYKDLGSVLLSITQMFVFEKGVGILLSDHRDAVAFHIVTKRPNELKTEITETLKHGATVINSSGMFTGEESSIIISIVNRRQIPEFLGILKNHPDAFIYYTARPGHVAFPVANTCSLRS